MPTNLYSNVFLVWVQEEEPVGGKYANIINAAEVPYLHWR
jgi:hypothetical protein